MSDIMISSRPTPDAHGEAALLLIESLMHELVARSILPLSAALNAIQIGIDAQVQVSDERDGPSTNASGAEILLLAIYNSLQIDNRTKINE